MQKKWAQQATPQRDSNMILTIFSDVHCFWLLNHILSARGTGMVTATYHDAFIHHNTMNAQLKVNGLDHFNGHHLGCALGMTCTFHEKKAVLFAIWCPWIEEKNSESAATITGGSWVDFQEGGRWRISTFFVGKEYVSLRESKRRVEIVAASCCRLFQRMCQKYERKYVFLLIVFLIVMSVREVVGNSMVCVDKQG